MGFFSNMYYGKANKADFTPENLPKNRVALYFDMLRIHFTGLINVNLCFLLTALPALIWLYMNVTAIGSIFNADPNAPTLLAQINGYLLQFFIGLIPCSLLLGPGICGMVNVTKQWACDEHSWVWTDFWRGFKENWKQGMLVAAIDAAALPILYFAQIFYAQQSGTNMFFFVLQMVLLILTVVFFMANLYIFPLMVTYKLTIGQLWRNALLLALGRLPWSVLWAAFLLLPVALMLFIPSAIAMMVIVLLYLLVLFAWQSFTLTSYTNATFDKMINPHIEGAPVNRGLRATEDDWDDDDWDDEDDEDDDDERAKKRKRNKRAKSWQNGKFGVDDIDDVDEFPDEPNVDPKR